MSKPNSRKRKGPKSTRSGCLMCKPHKHQREKGGLHGLQHRYRRAVADAQEQGVRTGYRKVSPMTGEM